MQNQQLSHSRIYCQRKSIYPSYGRSQPGFLGVTHFAGIIYMINAVNAYRMGLVGHQYVKSWNMLD